MDQPENLKKRLLINENVETPIANKKIIDLKNNLTLEFSDYSQPIRFQANSIKMDDLTKKKTKWSELSKINILSIIHGISSKEKSHDELKKSVKDVEKDKKKEDSKKNKENKIRFSSFRDSVIKRDIIVNKEKIQKHNIEAVGTFLKSLSKNFSMIGQNINVSKMKKIDEMDEFLENIYDEFPYCCNDPDSNLIMFYHKNTSTYRIYEKSTWKVVKYIKKETTFPNHCFNFFQNYDKTDFIMIEGNESNYKFTRRHIEKIEEEYLVNYKIPVQFQQCNNYYLTKGEEDLKDKRRSTLICCNNRGFLTIWDYDSGEIIKEEIDSSVEELLGIFYLTSLSKIALVHKEGVVLIEVAFGGFYKVVKSISDSDIYRIGEDSILRQECSGGVFLNCEGNKLIYFGYSIRKIKVMDLEAGNISVSFDSFNSAPMGISYFDGVIYLLDENYKLRSYNEETLMLSKIFNFGVSVVSQETSFGFHAMQIRKESSDKLPNNSILKVIHSKGDKISLIFQNCSVKTLEPEQKEEISCCENKIDSDSDCLQMNMACERKEIITLSYDGLIIYNPDTLEKLRKINFINEEEKEEEEDLSEGGVEEFKISPNEKYIFCSTITKKILIYDLDYSHFFRKVDYFEKKTMLTSSASDEQGKLIFACSDQVIYAGEGKLPLRAWEVKSGKLLKDIYHNKEVLTSLAITKKGFRLVAGFADAKIRIFNTKNMNQ